jgi:hypothetical protein
LDLEWAVACGAVWPDHCAGHCGLLIFEAVSIPALARLLVSGFMSSDESEFIDEAVLGGKLGLVRSSRRAREKNPHGDGERHLKLPSDAFTWSSDSAEKHVSIFDPPSKSAMPLHLMS